MLKAFFAASSIGIFLFFFFLTPKVNAAVWCQCCSGPDCSNIIGSCEDTDRNDGRPSCCGDIGGNDNYTSGCQDTSGGGGDGGGGGTTTTPKKECWETCTTSSQCRSPFVCALAGDSKNRCIYPGMPNDQTCRQLPVCNSVCNTTDACGSISHVVKLVNKPISSTKNVMVLDGVLEDNVTYEQNSSRFTYSPGWAGINSPNFRYSGGSLSFSSKAGDWVSFTSTSKKLKVMSSTSHTASQIEVYVDDVLIKTENRTPTGIEGSYSAPFEVVLESQDNGYTCYTDTSTTPSKSYCRLGENPTDPTCSVVNFQCTGVTKTPSQPKVGDNVVYTMNPVTSSSVPGTNITYHGKCEVKSGATILSSFNLSPSTSKVNEFQPFKVMQANTAYACMFRYCYLANGSNALTCSPWGQQ